MSNLVVVPARGGSKGVPGKNLRTFGGRSLLERAIECGRAASSVDEVVVSTDDLRIAEAAADAGALVIRRPAELATDDAPTPPLVVHALDQLDRPYDNVVLLQPPAPLRTGDDVDAVMAMLDGDSALQSVVSVYEVGDTHPGRMYRIGDDGVLRGLYPDLEKTRRQDLPPVYHRNGAIYATRVPALLESGELLTGLIGAYVMDRGSTVNIDTPEDLAVADHLIGQWDRSIAETGADQGLEVAQ